MILVNLILTMILQLMMTRFKRICEAYFLNEAIAIHFFILAEYSPKNLVSDHIILTDILEIWETLNLTIL